MVDEEKISEDEVVDLCGTAGTKSSMMAPSGEGGKVGNMRLEILRLGERREDCGGERVG